MDKAETFQPAEGLCLRNRSALYDLERSSKAVNYVYGLGGVISAWNILKKFSSSLEIAKTGKLAVYRHRTRERGGENNGI